MIATSQPNRIGPSGLVHTALGAFLVVWLLHGVGQPIATSFPAPIKYGALVAWFLLALARQRTYASDVLPVLLPTLVLLTMTFLSGVDLGDSGQNLQGLLYLVISLALGCFYASPRFATEARVVLFVAIVDFAITGYRTFVALLRDPELSRYLATTEDNRTAVFGLMDFSGLGGYGFVYSLVALFIVLASGHWRPNIPAYRWLALLAIGVVIVQMGFTTAIVLAAALTLIFRIMHTLSPGLRPFVIAGVILVWATGALSSVFEALAGLSSLQDAVRVRMGELADATSGSLVDGSDLDVRMGKWTQSIDAITHGGLFGNLGSTHLPVEVGGHSHWLDSAATFGLLSVLPLVSLVAVYRILNRCVSLQHVRMHRELFIYMLVLGMLNTLAFSTILVTWVVVAPLAIRWMSTGEKNDIPVDGVVVRR